MTDSDRPKVIQVSYLQDPETGELTPWELVEFSKTELQEIARDIKQDGEPDALHQGWEDMV